MTSLLALILPSPAVVQSLDAGPALWVLRGQGATVSLFGRMGVRADTDWLTPKFEKAFDTGDVLWLENPSTDPAAADELISELGFEDGYSVLDSLDESDGRRVSGPDSILSRLESAGFVLERL